MIRRPPRSTQSRSSAASDVYKRQLLDRRSAHRALEVVAVASAQLAVQHLVALEVGNLEVLEPVPDRIQALQVELGTLADLGHLTLGRVTHLAPRVYTHLTLPTIYSV